MLVVVEEGDKDDRYQKVPNQDDCWVQVRVAGEQHDYRCSDKKDQANQESTQPSPTTTRWVRGWCCPRVLRHINSPFAYLFALRAIYG